MGFIFKHGILIAVDSRASQGTYEADDGVQKVIEMNDMLLGTMAGGAADCQFWEQNLARLIKTYELQNGEKISVSGATQLFASMMFQNRGRGLSIGTQIAGFDDTGPHLYYLDNDGNRIEGKKFTCGSGGTYAYGILDTYWKMDLSVEEAVELGKLAISEATYNDAGSGGYCSVYHIY